jgi:hypothetical protein
MSRLAGELGILKGRAGAVPPAVFVGAFNAGGTMRAIVRGGFLVVALLILANQPTLACSLCAPGSQATATFREEAAQPYAKLILYGQFTESTARADGSGTAKYEILNVLRADPILGEAKEITVPRYVPVQDRKNPPHFLLFCDVFQKKVDPYRGIPFKTPEIVDYVKKGAALDPKDRVSILRFYFDYLEHHEPEIAADAYLEFAKAGDRDIGEAAKTFSPDKVRGWLRTAPPERLGVYAFVLGICGTEEDASHLQTLLTNPDERIRNAYDGILAGVLSKKPREGWTTVLNGLSDGKTPLALRLAMVRSVRLLHGWQPEANKANTLKAAQAVLTQGELADMAIEDLRRWKLWDLTPDVLGLYGKKGYMAPIMERAIVRYALCNKTDLQAKQFVEARRKDKPDLVKEVEEGLEFEK